MIDWMIANKEITAAILIGIATIVGALINFNGGRKSSATNNIIINTAKKKKDNSPVTTADPKAAKRILFVDDDTSFQVVKILKRAGWSNVRITKDIESLDSAIVLETDLFFVDIQGVGKALKFNDEGLGLALALKTKYPEKKVVIYSSEPKGNRFHQAFRVANDFLSKTAEPYEFQQVVDNLLLAKNTV